ncbi:MAG: hypothetical protein ACT4N4_01920 [Rhodospirillales bacterium]
MLTAVAPVRAGHEAPLYPSYYPQEIRVEAIEPTVAGRLLEASKIHAYVGGAPVFVGPAPETLRFVESLGSYLVVRVNPASAASKSNGGACAVLRKAVRAVAAGSTGFVVHPYPVNGFHADYLRHADRAEAAKARLLAGQPGDAVGPKPRMDGAMTQGAASPAVAEWDARIEEVDANRLVAGQRTAFNGWLGPPWIKDGWFHAYLLLSSALNGPARERAAAMFARLQAGRFANPADRVNAERELVADLTRDCSAAVAGYKAKREYYSAQYSDGIENIAWDSHDGLNSAIFLRAAKLKDFPWNGWLILGVPSPSRAAWNPFGGFTDPAGRLIWSALGDPGLFPEPYGAGWIMNRIGDVRPAAGK